MDVAFSVGLPFIPASFLRKFGLAGTCLKACLDAGLRTCGLPKWLDPNGVGDAVVIVMLVFAFVAYLIIAVLNVMVKYIASGQWRTTPRPEAKDILPNA